MGKLDTDILSEIQHRLKVAADLDEENRQLALDDLTFVGEEDSQWPEDIKNMRESENRPCLTINKLPAFISQVVGDQRMNRPSIKVVPVDSDGDPEIARILGGWIKHVQDISKSDIAIDHGFEHAVTCGYGALRVVTKYVNDYSLDQDAYIEKIDNALSVYWGKHSEYDCSDADYCIIITDMDRDDYKDTYNEEPMEFNSDNSQYIEGWCDKNTVRLAEYFVKEYKNKTIYFLKDGRTVSKEELTKKDIVIKSRDVKSYDIMWYLVSGNKILKKQKWVGKKYIPIIPIWGKELNIGGKRVIKSLVRNAKDSQRMYNFWSSIDTEVIAMQPRSPYFATPKQISGHEAQWNNSNKKNYPYLLVNFDEKAPGWPKRESPPIASGGIIERIRSTDQEMRDTIGLQKASLGMQSNERSGRAIVERKKEGDVGTFSFIDNLSRSIEQLGRVLIDIAPGVLDTERIIRLGLINDKHEFVGINQEIEVGGVKKIINDISVGTYDIVISVGPSFTTQRTEARQSMSEFIQYYPNAAPIIGDLYAKSMDWPGAEEVSERLEFLLPKEIKDAKVAKEAEEKGVSLPSPPPPQVSPEQQLKIQQLEAQLQEKQLQIEESKIDLEKEKTKLEQEKTKLIQMQQEVKMKTVDYIQSKKEEEV